MSLIAPYSGFAVDVSPGMLDAYLKMGYKREPGSASQVEAPVPSTQQDEPDAEPVHQTPQARPAEAGKQDGKPRTQKSMPDASWTIAEILAWAGRRGVALPRKLNKGQMLAVCQSSSKARRKS